MSTREKTKGAAASKNDAIAKTEAEAPEIAADDPQDAGTFSLASISQETLDAMGVELQSLLHQIDTGFGELTAPGLIFSMDQPFDLIDGFTINDYVDRTTGEEKTKHVFRLEFDGGVVKNVMQSDARPRRVLARAFELINQMGQKVRMGPYKFTKKVIPNQIQPAFIFTEQPGFRRAIVR